MKEDEKMGFPETFKALSDPVRREILTMLKEGRKSAGEIASHFDMTGATVSYHLSQLKKAGLIYEEREKNFIFYSLNISVFEEIIMWVSQFTADAGTDMAKEADSYENQA